MCTAVSEVVVGSDSERHLSEVECHSSIAADRSSVDDDMTDRIFER